MLLPLAADVFDDSESAYIEERLPNIVEPVLVIARDEHGPAGFKLGYRQDTSFYSWLGGTHPRARRQGIAAYLMQAQHDYVRSIVTRTRASNRAMITLNLKSGFEIVGFEILGTVYRIAANPIETRRLREAKTWTSSSRPA